MSMSDATDAAARSRELDELEDFLLSANSPAALTEIDIDEVRRNLGEDAASARPAEGAGQAARGGRA